VILRNEERVHDFGKKLCVIFWERFASFMYVLLKILMKINGDSFVP